MTASIVITTKNRKDELRRALQSCFQQQPAPEVIVIDDGSNDATSEMVRKEFPEARLSRSEISQGWVAQRNEGAKLANGSVIISLDDDAEFSTPHIVRQTLAAFSHPRVGAVTIPWVNVCDGPTVHQKSPGTEKIYVCRSFTGLAHAVKRDVFLRLGGYNALLSDGEESEFCIRLLNSGYVVRLGNADHVSHYESPKRNRSRQAYTGAYSVIMFGWLNAPWQILPLHILVSCANIIRYGVTNDYFGSRLLAIAVALANIPRHTEARKPVSLFTYYAYRKLTRRGLAKLSEISALLPPVADQQKKKGDLRRIFKGIKDGIRFLRSKVLVGLTGIFSQNFVVTNSPCVVFAPHPDDETLGAGGLIAAKRAIGARVHVVFLTDGGGSHQECGCVAADNVKCHRRREASEALRVLGVPSSDIIWIGLDDGGVPGNESPRHAATVRRISESLTQIEPIEVYCPHPHDHPTDHRAAAQLVRAAVIGIPSVRGLFFYAVWSWYLPSVATIRSYVFGKKLRLNVVPLLPRKRAALDCYFDSLPAPCGIPFCGRLSKIMVASCLSPAEFFIRDETHTLS